ncbi:MULTISPECIES: PadR family transcriptional regulator [Tenebrionibacter/Tenebrionicola group]|jgi:DNA-binding PadR family transcriptional regulator|uniref:PadR family transcriptional regulator n=2 Tax=Tenebrionibacter/Tenebrionicola group TaxID=2969848 RepID=A0A8K0V7F6_9ENTR|nr:MULTISPECIES: PadR family transcriptional regulator [Tenebrionibacter/Tenebrionicola group]MBK4715617.1 PadR family transcriptional regulator [Tenebrionibacter intestinalis]MBV4412923.1 PadR family transcriptional regulator [Tenebrionicola larvae]MBV5094599.1 PadR family transcriptional regulator [Tenebrionicola larvae]
MQNRHHRPHGFFTRHDDTGNPHDKDHAFSENERGEERHGKRPRFFGHGELRLVVLDILSKGGSHGYELIKAIEEQTGGLYTPSPGVIYPALDMLQAHGMIAVSEEGEGARKRLAITDKGRRWLEASMAHLAHIRQRMKARAVGLQLRKNPQMKRALDNFKAVLDLKANREDIDNAQIKKIIAIIDHAALKLAQLD